jgi:hypothetical protein
MRIVFAALLAVTACRNASVDRGRGAPVDAAVAVAPKDAASPIEKAAVAEGIGTGVLAGVVVTAKGAAPRSQVTVRAIPVDGLLPEDISATMDAEHPGTFVLEKLKPGGYKLVAESADHHQAIVDGVELRDREQRKDLRLELSRGKKPHYESPREALMNAPRDTLGKVRFDPESLDGILH